MKNLVWNFLMRPSLSVLLPSVLLLTGSAHAAPHAPKTVWKPDPQFIPKLAPETTIDGYRFRPPGGYLHREIKQGQPLHAWEAPKRKDGTHASLTLMVMHIPDRDPRTFPPDKVLDRFVGAVERSRTNWTRIPTQHGEVNGLPFVRTRWVGTDKITHRKMEGFQYVAVDGRTLVVVGSQDLDGQDSSLKLAETSVLTLRKAAGRK